MKIVSKNIDDTIRAAQDLAKRVKAGDVIALYGHLGAGKTVFVKALASSLGIKDTITSPTFVLMKVYSLPKGPVQNFVHVDCYRLDKPEDLSDIGLGDYLGQRDSIVVIEWADKIKNLPADSIRVDIDYRSNEKREIKITFPR